ncbi:MAG: FliA/WhiG family RNA polymerase sigma factor [Magnetococcales bacterium]|nr:FliA/WhiG family RNA polymerase sigma factor [Magnetococcales bacterium]
MQSPSAPGSSAASDAWAGLTREQIVMKYAPIVKYVAGRISLRLPQSVDMDDLYQVGILGLIDAIAKFDPERGIKFQTYAEFRVRGAILDELRAMDWVPRGVRHAASQLQDVYMKLEAQLGRPPEDAEMARQMGVSLEEYLQQLESVRGLSVVSFEDLRPSQEDDEWDVLDVLADPAQVDPVESLGLQQIREALSQAIASLPEKERLVVTLYYFEELTMSEIGAVLGLTESRISQLHSKATLRMRARIRKVLGGS